MCRLSLTRRSAGRLGSVFSTRSDGVLDSRSSGSRYVDRRLRSILAAQDDDLYGAQILKESIASLLYGISRHYETSVFGLLRALKRELTKVQAMERPISSQETAVRLLRLLLSHAQVDFKLLRLDLFSRHNETSSVTVALVVAIHVDKHSQTRRNVAAGSEMDAEVDLFGGDGDITGNMTVAVVITILCDFRMCAA